MPASIKIPTIFIAKDKFSTVVSKMTKGVKGFSKTGISAVKRFDSRVNRSFKRIGRLGALVGGLTIGTLFNTAIQGNIAFNDSLASVSAITGATGDDLAKLEGLAMNTAKETKKAGSEVLKAYELVGSAQPILLENADALDDVTRSVITLSKASRMDLEASTGSLTDVMNQFNKTGKESKDVVEALARGAKFGSAAIPQISEAIVQFGTVAKQSNVSLIESVAGVELFASKGIKGAEAGTKMRNVLTTLATAKALPAKALKELSRFGVDLDVVSDKTLPLNQRLKEMSKISGDATAMVKVFGKENQGAGSILLDNIDAFEKLNKQIGAKDGTNVALEQANTNTNTLAFALASLKTGFINTTTATNSNNSALEMVKDIMFTLAENMDVVLMVGASVVGLFVLMKAVILANTVVTTAYSIAMGIASARTGAMSIAMKGNVVAQTAYRIAMLAGTGATWLATVATSAFGIAMAIATSPITLIVLAVLAVIAVFYYWNDITDWFSKMWGKFTGWIGEKWDQLVSWFTDFDFKQMFMDIGQSIIKFMLTPLKFMLTLLSKLPGKIGDIAKKGLDTIGDLTGEVKIKPEGLDGDLGEIAQVLPSTAQASSESVQKTINDSNVRIDVRDKGGNVESVTQNGNDIPVNVGNTTGSF